MSKFLELIVDDEKIPYYWKDSILYYRRATREDINRITKKWTTKKGKNPRTGEPITVTDDVAVNNEIFDLILVAWDKVYLPGKGSAGERIEAPCTKENKMLVPLDIQAEITNRASSGEKDEEAEKKTLPSTSDS